MAMISGPAADAVRSRLTGLPRGVTLHVFTREDRLVIPGRDPAPMVRETVQLMEELAGLSERVQVRVHDMDAEPAVAERFGIARAPAVVPVAEDGSEDGVDYGIRFYGPPAGYEFGSLVEAIQKVATGVTELEPAAAEVLEGVKEPVHLQIFTTPT